MFLLKFLLLAFVCFLLYVAWIALQLVWKFRQMTRRFQSQQPDFQAQQSEQPRGAQASRQSDGSVIIDHRQPKPKKQQIIADDEGEYVDFEEN